MSGKSYEELRSAGWTEQAAREYVAGAERQREELAGLPSLAGVYAGRAPTETRSAPGADVDPMTAGGAARSFGLVLPGAPPLPTPDTAERRAAQTEFSFAHGWIDRFGIPTHHYLAQMEMREQHMRNLHGLDWLGYGDGLTDAEVRQIVGRIRSARIAASAAEAAGYGPADADAHMAEVQRRAAALSGVESWTPPDALERTAAAMGGTVWQGVHHDPPPFDAERGA